MPDVAPVADGGKMLHIHYFANSTAFHFPSGCGEDVPFCSKTCNIYDGKFL